MSLHIPSLENEFKKFWMGKKKEKRFFKFKIKQNYVDSLSGLCKPNKIGQINKNLNYNKEFLSMNMISKTKILNYDKNILENLKNSNDNLITSPNTSINLINKNSNKSYLTDLIPMHNNFKKSFHNEPICIEYDPGYFEPNLIRVPVLGSPQSGKTTLIQQFVYCQLKNISKQLPVYYDPLITTNNRCYHLRLIDCPLLDNCKLPKNSLEEWESYQGWCLRNASAYILVFDITSESSFHFVKQLRAQIIQHRGQDVPLIIVANKLDLLHSQTQMLLKTEIEWKAFSAKLNFRRNISIMVKKHWKRCNLVECSAKYNWHIMQVFKELIKIVVYYEQIQKPMVARAVVNSVLKHKQCIIM